MKHYFDSTLSAFYAILDDGLSYLFSKLYSYQLKLRWVTDFKFSPFKGWLIYFIIIKAQAFRSWKYSQSSWLYFEWLKFVFRNNTSGNFLKILPYFLQSIPVDIYLFKVNNKNTRTRCEICSKLTMKTPERRQWRCSGVFIVNFEHISHLILVFLLLTLGR